MKDSEVELKNRIDIFYTFIGGIKEIELICISFQKALEDVVEQEDHIISGSFWIIPIINETQLLELKLTTKDALVNKQISTICDQLSFTNAIKIDYFQKTQRSLV